MDYRSSGLTNAVIEEAGLCLKDLRRRLGSEADLRHLQRTADP